MGKSIYEPIYHINVVVIQLQSNLLFQYTIKLEKSYEIINQYGWQEMQFVNKYGWQEVEFQYVWLPLNISENKKNKTLTF